MEILNTKDAINSNAYDHTESMTWYMHKFQIYTGKEEGH